MLEDLKSLIFCEVLYLTEQRNMARKGNGRSTDESLNVSPSMMTLLHFLMMLCGSICDIFLLVGVLGERSEV